MGIHLLEEIGLTRSEIDIYTSLLRLGPSTITPLKKEITISSSKLYEFLDSLNKKGLITYVKTESGRLFRASDPEALNGIVEQKKLELNEKGDEIKDLIKDLVGTQNTIQKEGSFAHIYEGLDGLKRYYHLVYNKTLSKGDTQYSILIPQISNKLFEGSMLAWHDYRIKRGIKIKYIYNSDGRKFGKKRAKMPLSEIRYLKNNIQTPCYIEIFGDFVAICELTNKIKVFVIKSKEAVRSFKFLFEMMWEISEN